MRNVPGLETIQRDYASRGVKFYYIYKALAHPEKDGYVTPFTLGERLKHIAEARRTLGTKFTWLCDAMDNRAKHAMGNAPNSEFVVDPEGKVVRRRAWSDPSQLRRDLEKLVGPVDRPTRVSDLDMKTARPPQAAASGVVPRLSLPPALQAVRIVPVVEEGGLPFYVKLRAEADAGLLSGGRGQLYLGFHLDPIYGVSWNNLVAPVKFQLQLPDGLAAKPVSGEGPKVKAASDSDPREFLVRIEGRTKEPIGLTVRYFGCNKAEGWCTAITQKYQLYLDRDPDGGRAMRRGSGRRPGAGPAGGGGMVMGSVRSIDPDAGTLTVRTREGGTKTVKVPRAAQIMRNGRRARLKDIEAGDRVRIQLDGGGSETPSVRRMNVRSSF